MLFSLVWSESELKIIIIKKNYRRGISLKPVARRCSISKLLIKVSQNSLENTCARASIIIILRAVPSAPSQEYIKDKILTHVPAFISSNSFLFCFLSQRSDLSVENFILNCIVVLISEVYSETCQTCKMKIFWKIVSDLKPQFIFAKTRC